MTQQQIIDSVIQEVKITLKGADSGHDWWHMYRVAQLADQIAMQEGADRFLVQLGAWLHDIADWKFHNGDETIGPKLAKHILQKFDVPQDAIDHTCDIITTISYKGAGVTTEMKTLEGKIVQDADRLDAIGAIGVARTFVYGGFKNRSMHIPGESPEMHATSEAYKNSQGTVINHFYEKLLLLKDRMNTQTAKNIAQQRHNFMELYLHNFLLEWDAQDATHYVISQQSEQAIKV